jgi:hypothetical protein
LDNVLGQTRSMEPYPTSLVAAFDNETIRILWLPAFANWIQRLQESVRSPGCIVKNEILTDRILVSWS